MKIGSAGGCEENRKNIEIRKICGKDEGWLELKWKIERTMHEKDKVWPQVNVTDLKLQKLDSITNTMVMSEFESYKIRQTF